MLGGKSRYGEACCWLICLGLVALPGAITARADQPAPRLDNSRTAPPLLRGVGIDQRLDQPVPLDLQFSDEAGKPVELRNYFGKKPVVLALVYYHCPMLCTMVLNGLLESLKQLKFDVGDQFNVVTVSFDPSEKPELARAKKAVYVGLYGRRGAAEGWHFLTGDEASIRQLTQAVGFHFNAIPHSDQFAHSTAIMVLTPEGKLSRYFYGIQYPARDLRLALVEAAANRIGSPVDQLVLFCCQYDPATGKYGVIISRIIQLAGVVTVLVVGTMMLVLFRREGHAQA